MPKHKIDHATRVGFASILAFVKFRKFCVTRYDYQSICTTRFIYANCCRFLNFTTKVSKTQSKCKKRSRFWKNKKVKIKQKASRLIRMLRKFVLSQVQHSYQNHSTWDTKGLIKKQGKSHFCLACQRIRDNERYYFLTLIIEIVAISKF